MTTTTRSTENDMTPLFRTEIKRNGIVIRGIRSESGHTYHVTVFEGNVSSCEQASGDVCQGWRYRHSCHHATLAMQLEAERTSVELETSQKGALNGSSQGFSLMRR